MAYRRMENLLKVVWGGGSVSRLFHTVSLLCCSLRGDTPALKRFRREDFLAAKFSSVLPSYHRCPGIFSKECLWF